MAKTFYHGLLKSSTDALQMPSKKFQNGWLKTMTGNSGNVCIGSSSDVTIVGSATDNDIVSGLELDANQLFPLDTPGNLSDYWYIMDTSGDKLEYFLEDW